MKKIILVIALLASGFVLKAQDSFDPPQVLQPSPQAAAYARYGEIPLNHTTGVPQISIPLYTLSTGFIDIPISLSYHASGIKVQDVATPAGLGWVLNAGGVISRTIEGGWDKGANDRTFASDAELTQKISDGMNDINITAMGINMWEEISKGRPHSSYNIRSDRYSYNFLGNSGIARYDYFGGTLKPVPYSPLVITPAGSYFNQTFTITDTKGIQYVFGEGESTTAQNNNLTTAWYLTKIIYPGMESDAITFTYKKSTSYTLPRTYSKCASYYDDGTKTLENQGLYNNPYWQSNSVIQGTTYTSVVLDKITWRDVVVQFNYAADRVDYQKERLTSMQVKHNNAVIKQVEFNTSGYFGTGTARRLKLSQVTLSGTEPDKGKDVYSFQYNTTALPALDSGNEDFWGYYGDGSNSLFPSEFAPSFLPATFVGQRLCNESKMKACILEEITYPTGGKTKFVYEANRVSGLIDNNTPERIVGGLRLKQRINYPAGTTVADVKEYEYSGYSTGVLGGGIFENNSTTLGIKRNWVPGATGLSHMPVLKETRIKSYHSIPIVSITGNHGSAVFYTKIKEYDGYKTAHNGWTEYRYEEEWIGKNLSQIENDISIRSSVFDTKHWDRGNVKERLLSTAVLSKTGDTVKKIVNEYEDISIPSIQTGYIIEKPRTYTQTYEEIILHAYSDIIFTSTGNMIARIPDWIGPRYYDYHSAIRKRETYAEQSISLLSRTTETEFRDGKKISKSVSYTYPKQTVNGVQVPVLLEPSVITTQGSSNIGNSVHTITYSFANATMKAKNMLSYKIQESTSINGSKLRTHKNNYGTGNGAIVLSNVQTAGSDDVFRTEISYSYDSKWNIQQYTGIDGVTVSFIWGYNQKYPVVKVVGETYANVAAKITAAELSAIQAGTYTDAQLRTTCHKIRTALASSNAQVFSFTHKPLVGILSETDPNNISTYYEYDNFGRLVRILDNDSKVLQQFEYKYKNQ